MSSELEAIVAALKEDFERAGEPCAVHSTHISIVLLAGAHAYKFKRPVALGFVDFSTLARRRHFCARELELNRRFAPDIYLRVASVTRSGDTVRLDGDGEVVEYAVVMRRFDQAAILDQALARGAAGEKEFANFGRDLAALHAAAAPATAVQAFGSADLVRTQILASFEHLPALAEVTALERRVTDLLDANRLQLTARKAAGHVRECHGDLHLGNVLLEDGRARPFDCIEFNDELRVIDTISDLAFLVMDLDSRAASRLANVVLNHYLDASGDFTGVGLLSLYCAYRALVRAKVTELQRRSTSAEAHPALLARRDDYLRHAGAYLAGGAPPGLVITHGVSGSGKSYHSLALAARTGFIHLRSDRERRRLHGHGADPQAGGRLEKERYSAERTTATYARLLELARMLLGAGHSVIVDATFLEHSWRARFAALAEELGAAFHILACAAPQAVLAERIKQRREAGQDPSEATVAVMQAQLARVEPLEQAERAFSVFADGIDFVSAARAELAPLGRARPGAEV